VTVVVTAIIVAGPRKRRPGPIRSMAARQGRHRGRRPRLSSGGRLGGSKRQWASASGTSTIVIRVSRATPTIRCSTQSPRPPTISHPHPPSVGDIGAFPARSQQADDVFPRRIGWQHRSGLVARAQPKSNSVPLTARLSLGRPVRLGCSRMASSGRRATPQRSARRDAPDPRAAARSVRSPNHRF
jgi:hypothetical protein